MCSEHFEPLTLISSSIIGHIQLRISTMKKYGLLALVASLVVVGGAFAFLKTEASASTIVVYKSPTCGCCAKWIDHLEESGFDVEVRDETNMNAVKAKHGVRPEYSSCHTALVEGYIVEGHVPADQIVRLLAEKPAVLGISAPGMPIGSTGMESANPSQHQDYDVVTFDGSGKTELFARIKATR